MAYGVFYPLKVWKIELGAVGVLFRQMLLPSDSTDSPFACGEHTGGVVRSTECTDILECRGCCCKAIV